MFSYLVYFWITYKNFAFCYFWNWWSKIIIRIKPNFTILITICILSDLSDKENDGGKKNKKSSKEDKKKKPVEDDSSDLDDFVTLPKKKSSKLLRATLSDSEDDKKKKKKKKKESSDDDEDSDIGAKKLDLNSIIYVLEIRPSFAWSMLTLWRPNKIFGKCNLVPNKKILKLLFGAGKKFRFLTPGAGKKFDRKLFRRPPTVFFYFLKKVLVLFKSAVYLFCRELNSLQYGENSI